MIVKIAELKESEHAEGASSISLFGMVENGTIRELDPEQTRQVSESALILDQFSVAYSKCGDIFRNVFVTRCHAL